MAEEVDGLLKYLEKDLEATDASKLRITEKMTDLDYFSDMSQKQIVGVAGLTALNKIVKSKILESFLEVWIIARKSKSRKSRKEGVEMFKSLREQEQSRMDIMRDKLGSLFQ